MSKTTSLICALITTFIWGTAFIAQELYSVYPEAASKGGADPKEDPWSVNYGRLTPILTKALQEAMARIESLEAEVNKLKGE